MSLESVLWNRSSFGLVFTYYDIGHQVHPYVPLPFQSSIFLVGEAEELLVDVLVVLA
jgi:hypothetical protein